MKRLFSTLFLVLTLALPVRAAETTTIGVTPFPHKDIVRIAKGLPARNGSSLAIRECNDYAPPNNALAANYFQHIPHPPAKFKDEALTYGDTLTMNRRFYV